MLASVSPGLITPPTVCTSRLRTRPETGARAQNLILVAECFGAAVLDEQHLVDLVQNLGAMCRHDNDAACRLQLAQCVQQCCLSRRVEMGVRLIENDEERLAEYGAGQTDTLLLESNREQLAVTRKEMTALVGLRDKGLLPMTRWMPVQRQEAALVGDVGSAEAQIATAKGQIAEAQLKLLEADEGFRKEALNDLQIVDGELSQLVEKRGALEQKLTMPT